MRKLKRIRIGDLRRILKEEMNLESATQQKKDSIDSQIDRFFVQGENESIQSVNEVFDWRRTTQQLLEADDDEKTEKTKKDAQNQIPDKKTIDDIDVDEFAVGIVRLVKNFENLIETKSTIVRRAINFLNKTYDDNVTETFLSILRDDEGLSPDQSEKELEDDNFTAPFAERSGGGGA